MDSATVPSPFPAWGAVLRRVRAIWGGAQSQLCPRLPVTHGLLTPDDLLETTAHPSESVWVPRGVLRTPQHVLAPGGRCCWLPVETQGRAARGWEPVQGDQGMSTVPAFFFGAEKAWWWYDALSCLDLSHVESGVQPGLRKEGPTLFCMLKTDLVHSPETSKNSIHPKCTIRCILLFSKLCNHHHDRSPSS